MARFIGKVGFERYQRETEPGVYEPVMIEQYYFCTVLKHLRKWESSSDGPNDNLTLGNRISIVCDNYMQENWPAIKYVEWCGTKWKVESAEIVRPRITLVLGGVWNGPQA